MFCLLRTFSPTSTACMGASECASWVQLIFCRGWADDLLTSGKRELKNMNFQKLNYSIICELSTTHWVSLNGPVFAITDMYQTCSPPVSTTYMLSILWLVKIHKGWCIIDAWEHKRNKHIRNRTLEHVINIRSDCDFSMKTKIYELGYATIWMCWFHMSN